MSKTTDSSTPTSSTPTIRFPKNITLQKAAEIAILKDKPIMMDYWAASLDKKCLISVRTNGEKNLVKYDESNDEYTSPITKIIKSDTEYICLTVNAIYLVDYNISSRKIS